MHFFEVSLLILDELVVSKGKCDNFSGAFDWFVSKHLAKSMRMVPHSEISLTLTPFRKDWIWTEPVN